MFRGHPARNGPGTDLNRDIAMTENGTLTLTTVAGDGLSFSAAFPRGTLVMESGAAAQAPNPVQALLASVGACIAIDVITVLRKQRQQVTAYEVLLSGDRATTVPHRFTHIRYTHRITGHAVKREGIDLALKLAMDKYCSAYHCLRPDLTVENTVEILEG
jgi:putative redox protein